MEKSINWPAPAKVNWFLQVNGRRSDGYHNIQTYFQFLELQDRLDFILRDDQAICLSGTAVMHDIEEDLTVRAANMLKSHCGIKRGVEIQLKKKFNDVGKGCILFKVSIAPEVDNFLAI